MREGYGSRGVCSFHLYTGVSLDSQEAVRGTLILEAVTPDSLAGRGEVPGYAPEPRANHFNVVSYNVHARIGAGPDSLIALHTLQRDPAGGAPRCSLRDLLQALPRPGH